MANYIEEPKVDISKFKAVNNSFRKKDALALTSGKPVYTDDIASKDALIVKLLHSPHAHALIEDIDVSRALMVPGIECALTYKDVPDKRFTIACQAYPEPSNYDRLILDRRVRFVGDPVAIVAGEDEKAVDKALKLIKVKYEVLDAVLDFRKSKDNEILVHPEDGIKTNPFFPEQIKRNIVFYGETEYGDVNEEFSNCDYVLERTYHTVQNNQTPMEPFTTFANLDPYGRITIVSSTQTPFHVRRIIANALDIPKSQVRVVKPRIGGGFGAKQSSVSEMYPAIVTLKTGKPSKIFYSRTECFSVGSPRHEMEMTVKIGSTKDGKIRAMELHTLSNTGAYNEHGSTTVGLTATKSLSLYGRIPAQKFSFDVVYTNKVPSGAYRGFGATQGVFAIESIIDELASEMKFDPVKLRELNLLTPGEAVFMYENKPVNTCNLDKCIAKAKDLIGWDSKYPRKDMGNAKVRSVGLAMAMQGSGIANIDVAGVEIRLSDHGFYHMNVGAADIGTGSDTILSQIACESLGCTMDDIVVSGVDTDVSPYDAGAYASSTTYITGMAVVKTCEKITDQILTQSARMLGVSKDILEFDGKKIFTIKGADSEYKELSLFDLAAQTGSGSVDMISASESHFSEYSPPPFMVGAVEIEIDKTTGKVDIIDYVGVLDCGTPINPNLVRIQAEGGIAQGIGMALWEDVQFNAKGKLLNDSFMSYKIPSRLDIRNVRIYLEPTYEPTGPFGAKSVGELVINTPCPALANAIANATGVRLRELPMTSEKIMMALLCTQ
ncbi:MAG: molybdopterin cofactor-binding domain-containing protein [Proteocatella sp.]